MASSSAAAIWAAYPAYAALLGTAARRRAIPLPLLAGIARPTSALVTGGIYRWSRNPQYDRAVVVVQDGDDVGAAVEVAPHE